MESNTTQVNSIVDINVPLFQPFPANVLIKEYDAFGVVEQKIFFRNNDNVCRRVKILQPDSPYFEVSAARDPKGNELKQSTIGAGMECCFIVKFKPQEIREYKVDLVCLTEREKFVIPVYAMGPRPVLDFPDEIVFPTTAVKNTTEKTLIVRNVGTCEAHFSLMTDDNVFGASPADGLVEVGQTVMVTLTFTPKKSLDYSGELVIQYQGTDTTSYVALNGAAENVEVFLSAPSVQLEPAYISLSSQVSSLSIACVYVWVCIFFFVAVISCSNPTSAQKMSHSCTHTDNKQHTHTHKRTHTTQTHTNVENCKSL